MVTGGGGGGGGGFFQGGGARLLPMTGEVNEICLTLLHSFFRSFESDSELSSGNVISFWFKFWSFTVCFVV